MNFLDATTLCHICSFVIPQRAKSNSLSIFGVCREWRTSLCGPVSVPFWQRLFHARFPRFLQPVSPSKKRSVSAVSHDYRLLLLQTAAILQIDSSLYNPASVEGQDPLLELPNDNTRYRSELMESIALRLFSKKFAQFGAYNRHHLLYGPAGCGKATLIESLARMWGSHLITLQYPDLVRIAANMEWPGYVDILCNYIQSFCDSSFPTILHIRHMSNQGTPLTQHPLNGMLKSLPIANVWVIGTTIFPHSASVQHSEHLTAKLYIPFPTAAERETYLKARFFPNTSSSFPLPKITTLSLPLASSPQALTPPLTAACFEPKTPVSAPYIHLLAVKTQNFTYTDLSILCDMLKDEYMRGDQKNSLPFVKLMDVLARMEPFYKPEDTKRYESGDLGMVTQTTPEKRRLSVPTVF